MNTSKKKLLSMVFSFRNEEENLPEFLKRIEKVLNKINYEYEFIFVNDASTDNSLEILEKARLNNQRIKIINMSRKFGVSAAVIAGFQHATGEAVIYMDSDLQDPPELIPELVKKWEEGSDVVHTVRTKRRGENIIRMLLVKLAYKIIGLFADIEILQNSGNFKLMSRRALNGVLKLNDPDPFLRGLSVWVGFRQISIPYEREARFSGKTKFSLLRSTHIYKDFIRGITSYSTAPLYLSLWAGFIVSLMAFIFVIMLIFYQISIGVENSGWTSTMVTILFLGGAILFAIGILGVYLGKIHEAIKQRPRYLIESKKGFDKTDN